MSLLTKLFHYVLLSVSKYKIDESHGLSHSMEILTQANKIYENEVIKHPYIKNHEKIIYVSSVLHDMCDKKYMNQDDGIKDIDRFLYTIKDDNYSNYISPKESSVIKDIVSTMSYSTVKKKGFPNLGKYQMAYNIVREADLLCAYDFDRCMIYQMTQKNYDLIEAYNDSVNLFQNRMFKHNEDGLFLTDYTRNNYIVYENNAKLKINYWKKILSKKL